MVEQLNFEVSYVYADRSEHGEGIVIPVVLHAGGRPLQTYGNIDTGAQFCIFSREIGLQLGLEIEHGYYQVMSSLAGTLETYGHAITIQTFGFAFESFIYFAKQPGLRRNLLGRNGYLRHTCFGLVDYENRLFLAEYR